LGQQECVKVLARDCSNQQNWLQQMNSDWSCYGTHWRIQRGSSGGGRPPIGSEFFWKSCIFFCV